MGAGTGAGLSQRFLGQTGGQERVTLTIAQMPKHRHALRASSAAADSKAPAGEVLANVPGKATYNSQTADAKMNSNAIGTTGGSQPVATMPPFLGLSCIIALEGIFPSQNSVQKP